MKRRTTLVLLGAAASVGSCAHHGAEADRIIDLASGRELTRKDLLAELRQCRYVLLGEQHDNPHHHARRGALIPALGPYTTVVAEHLPRGSVVAGPAGADLRSRLEASGFDGKAWRWPLHQALFAPIIAAGLPLQGGNAELSLVRRVAREGSVAWPAELRAVLERAALDDTAQGWLDADLLAGHCGHLPAVRMPAMRAAQRLRDATMALALQASAGRPAVLVAGNGHVRSDYGVAQVLRAVEPQARMLNVGFGEPGTAIQGAPYSYLWLTPGVPRDDVCAGFTMPAQRG